MQRPLQITLRDIAHSMAVESIIRDKAKKLELHYPRIQGCKVVVGIPGKHKHQGKEFNVRIDLTVPGSEIVITRDRHEDVYVALRDAFDAAKRRLEDYGRRQRGEIKAHAEQVNGQPIWETAEEEEMAPA